MTGVGSGKWGCADDMSYVSFEYLVCTPTPRLKADTRYTITSFTLNICAVMTRDTPNWDAG